MNIINHLKNPLVLQPVLGAVTAIVKSTCQERTSCMLQTDEELERYLSGDDSMCDKQYPFPICEPALKTLNMASQASQLFLQGTLGKSGLQMIRNGYNALFQARPFRFRRRADGDFVRYRPRSTIKERIAGIGQIAFGAVILGGAITAISAQCLALQQSLTGG